jgi:hypothetical protein
VTRQSRYDVGEYGGRHVIVMELLQGTPLQQQLTVMSQRRYTRA